MKSYEIIAKPFIEKANLIRNTFSQHDDEQRSGKSVRVHHSLDEKISFILNTCPEKFKKATHYQIKNSNLLLLIFLHEDISKIYNESAISLSVNLEKMENIRENFLTLALIGDRALELGTLIRILEEENKSQGIPFKEDLDKKKKNFVENKNLAKIWDSLALYDDEILRQKKNESQKLKGSRMEAFFGIIYLESGFDVVENAIKNLILTFNR